MERCLSPHPRINPIVSLLGIVLMLTLENFFTVQSVTWTMVDR